MTAKVEKILRLALDRAAPDGEWKSAAVMFVASLRRAGATVEEFTRPTAPAPRSHAPAPPQMPFGKYKGLILSEIPTDYLEWLANNCQLRPQLKKAVRAELKRRD